MLYTVGLQVYSKAKHSELSSIQVSKALFIQHSSQDLKLVASGGSWFAQSIESVDFDLVFVISILSAEFHRGSEGIVLDSERGQTEMKTLDHFKAKEKEFSELDLAENQLNEIRTPLIRYVVPPL